MIIDSIFQQHSSKWVIKWTCSNCNYEHLDNVGFFKPTPSMDKQIKCPKCKSFGKDDYQRAIKARIEQLTEKKSLIDVEINKLIREIEPEKKAVLSYE